MPNKSMAYVSILFRLHIMQTKLIMKQIIMYIFQFFKVEMIFLKILYKQCLGYILERDASLKKYCKRSQLKLLKNSNVSGKMTLLNERSFLE